MSKILIIDDDVNFIEYMNKKLTKENFEVSFTNISINAINLVKKEKPDLILLDIIMPEISGIEICKSITSDPQTSNIPVIFITGKISPEDVQTGFQAGAYDYIKKPIDSLEFLARIRSALKFREAQKLVIETEILKTFAATVVTANHKIKQPLTLINLSLSAIKREISKDEISSEAIMKRLSYIENAVNEINDVLKQLTSVEKPKISNYLNDIKMIDVK